MRKWWRREEVQESQGPRVPMSRDPKVPGSQWSQSHIQICAWLYRRSILYSYWYSNNYMYLNNTIHIHFDFENSYSFWFWEWILFIFVSYSENKYYSYLFQNYNLCQHYYYLQPRAMEKPQPSISFLRSLYLQNLKFYIFAQSQLNPKLRSLHLILSFLEYTVIKFTFYRLFFESNKTKWHKSKDNMNFIQLLNVLCC